MVCILLVMACALAACGSNSSADKSKKAEDDKKETTTQEADKDSTDESTDDSANETASAESETLAAPKLGTWEKYTGAGSGGDGVTFRITWDPVSGAEGYEVIKYDKDDESEDFSTMQATTTDCFADESFSSTYQIGAQVRAFKTVNGQKTYSEWSDRVIKTIEEGDYD